MRWPHIILSQFPHVIVINTGFGRFFDVEKEHYLCKDPSGWKGLGRVLSVWFFRFALLQRQFRCIGNIHGLFFAVQVERVLLNWMMSFPDRYSLDQLFIVVLCYLLLTLLGGLVANG